MIELSSIQEKVLAGAFEYSEHALDQSILRGISVAELREAISRGTIVESYPDDKYGPSCLIFGFTGSSRPIHIVATSGSRPLVKIITIYEPDSEEWINFRVRRA